MNCAYCNKKIETKNPRKHVLCEVCVLKYTIKVISNPDSGWVYVVMDKGDVIIKNLAE